MLLRRVRVENIRSYESAELDLGRGTTLLVGDVGSGKTSLLYAIEMALFGVAEVDAAYLVRHGAPYAEVAVMFEGGDHTYEVARRFRRVRRKGRPTFEPERIRFTVDGVETSYSATELRQRVIDLFGFPDNPSPQAHSDLWRWAVYVPQERMRDILAAHPQDRLETVRKALGVERYRTAADNAQELAADLRRSAGAWRAEAERLRHFETTFERGTVDIARLREDRTAHDVSARARESELAQLTAQRVELETGARRAEADARELSGLEREQAADLATLTELEQSVAGFSSELQARKLEGERALADARALEERRSAVDDGERTVARIRESLTALAARLRELSEARARMTSLEQRLADERQAADRRHREAVDAQTTLDEGLREGPPKAPSVPTPSDLPALEAQLRAVRARETEAVQLLARAESSLQEIDELLRDGVCPRCHQPVVAAEFGAHELESKTECERARSQLRAIQDERARTEAERAARERYERAFDRWTEVEKRRLGARTGLDRARSAGDEAEAAVRRTEELLVHAQARASELAPFESRESREREALAEATAGQAERTQALERSLQAAERYEGLERASEIVRGEVERRRRDLARGRERIDIRRVRLEELRPAVSRAADIQRSLADLDHSLRSVRSAYDTARAELAGIQTRLDDTVRNVREAELGRAERARLLRAASDAEEKAAWVGQPFRQSLLSMEQGLLTHAQAIFEREFARYFASLVDDPALVARTDPAFTPLVMIEGEWTPAEALSGGERTSLALAFRLALARVVRTLGTLRVDALLLDEPTDGFSPEQVVRMGELLEELGLPQVVLVSHESQLAAVADRVVRVSKAEGRSTLESSPSAATDGESPAAANATPAGVEIDRRRPD